MTSELPRRTRQAPCSNMRDLSASPFTEFTSTRRTGNDFTTMQKSLQGVYDRGGAPPLSTIKERGHCFLLEERSNSESKSEIAS